ncbi:GIY-YIG nuclease family protein [Lysobacter capsici]|uniref:GIY-YIG nuclease family protein n=1 Tax=Lysobacter capsici TaxID=435897 RepID=UPI00287BC2FD|nr:GIY-YIG nuclease family protein [Lysobacter capsici]WND81130.1 GIY-YIG nuclease family protein [Lysobacter capsici]WND86326.1 GIY-YIG nuclease family protein [Lysobacter capsici]
MNVPDNFSHASTLDGPSSDSEEWQLYLLECRDGSYYVGITANLPRRLRQHLAGRGGTYTRRHPVARLVASRAALSRAQAAQWERDVKRLPLVEKLRYFDVPLF